MSEVSRPLPPGDGKNAEKFLSDRIGSQILTTLPFIEFQVTINYIVSIVIAKKTLYKIRDFEKVKF